MNHEKILGSPDATNVAPRSLSGLSGDASVAVPKRGLRFIHASWLDGDNRPLKCVVTRVARGVAYYRPVGGGAPMKCGLEEFPRYAKVQS